MSEDKVYNIIVVGAGVSGLFFSSINTSPGPKLIINNTVRPGLKLIASGGGQGNITNIVKIKEFIDKYGDNGKLIRKTLYKFNNLDLEQYLTGLGVETCIKNDNKVYLKEKPQNLIDKLLAKAKKNKFQLITEEEIVDIEYNGIFKIKSQRGTIYKCQQLIIATGGKSYPATGSNATILPSLLRLGIAIKELKPALTPVFVMNYPFEDLAGVSINKVKIKVIDRKKHQEENSILFAHKYFTGPGILNISRYLESGTKIHINYCPDLNFELAVGKLIKLKENNSIKTISAVSKTLNESEVVLPRRFIEKQLLRTELDDKGWLKEVSNNKLKDLMKLFFEDEYQVENTGGFKDSMVTAGGIALEEIDLNKYEVKKYPGMYIVGEALDIDGSTGGYNIQFAFSSAFVANLSITNNSKPV